MSEIYDMFGSLSDDPRLRLLREQQHDRANAQATYEARVADPRWWETPESLADELFSPLDQLYGGRSPERARSSHPKVINAGGNLFSISPDGDAEVLWRPPDQTQAKLENAKLEDLRLQRRALLRDRPNPSTDGVGAVGQWDNLLNTLSNQIASAEMEIVPRTTTPSRAPGVSFIGNPASPTNAFQKGFDSIAGSGGSRIGNTPAEVIRRVNGRRAVFDANTRRFLRYAD
jgi:hypothetical protein